MALVIIACRVLQSLIEPHLQRRQPPVPATFLEYGFHRTPQLMTPALQAELDRLPEPSTVILGYGLCGNGLAGLKAGPHTLLVPRTDDCIAILLGTYERYQQEFSAEPGTIYLSRGWLESGSHPLKEYHQLLDKYDQETAEWIIDEQYRNYRRLVLVAPTEAELAECRPAAQEVAAFCAARWGFRYQEILGSPAYVERLMTQVPALAGPNDDFLVVSPGGEIKPEMFWR
jgi:hypothetical protein